MNTAESPTSWETVYWASQLLLVLFAGVALISGAVVNKRQSKQLLTLETNLEGQRRETEGLKKANIEAQSALEKERTARVEMEKSLAVRGIVIDFNKRKTNVDVLRPFAGIQFILRSLPDAEPARAAISLNEVLQFAGWIRAGREISSEFSSPTLDGVVIESYMPEEMTNEKFDERKRLQSAATALADFLKSNGWEARVGPTGAWKSIPPNTVQITIGFKPPPYFLTNEMKDLMEKVERAKKQAREAESKP